MSGGKTSEQKTTQMIDPTIANESEALMNLFRTIAKREKPQYEGVNVAAFTPDQEAAFKANRNAASAFGMPAGEAPSTPKMRTQDGIRGYSTYDAATAGGGGDTAKAYRAAMGKFFKKAGKGVEQEEFDTGGGKGK